MEKLTSSGLSPSGNHKIPFYGSLITIKVPYFPNYRLHSILSRTPNSDRQYLRFQDQETPECDSSYIIIEYAYACLAVNLIKMPKLSHISTVSRTPFVELWSFM